MITISNKIKRFTNKYRVKFIINDNYNLALNVKADGCHMGQLDGSFRIARYKLKNKILGITCHSSKKLAKNALKYNPDYIAFGSFYKSNLKPNAKKANASIVKWAHKNLKKPIVVIGGIDDKNYKRFVKFGAKYIAISSFIWDNPKLKPELAIRKFK